VQLRAAALALARPYAAPPAMPRAAAAAAAAADAEHAAAAAAWRARAAAPSPPPASAAAAAFDAAVQPAADADADATAAAAFAATAAAHEAAAAAAAALRAPGCYLLCADLSASYGAAEPVQVPVVGPTPEHPLPGHFRYITDREGVSALAGAAWHEGVIACGCAGGCGQSGERVCEHVAAFDADHPDAVDRAGRPMAGRLPYDVRSGGVCVLGRGCGAPVHECNARCACGPGCASRVLQRGLAARLHLRPAQRHAGWGVFASAPIANGAFIAEYLGELLSNTEASRRAAHAGDGAASYLFSIDTHAGGEDADDADDAHEHASVFVLDAARAGNVARFINHSCAPNCRVRAVMYDSADPRLARLGIFALRAIAAGEEVCYDYGGAQHGGRRAGGSASGGVRCACGAAKCRGWLWQQ
jgi:hypothetical protein